jgi:hypothetical protein
MGWQWVNNTANTVPSSGPAIPGWLPEWAALLIVMFFLAAGVAVVVYIIAKGIEAFFDWFAGLIAGKVVEKLEGKEAGGE